MKCFFVSLSLIAALLLGSCAHQPTQEEEPKDEKTTVAVKKEEAERESAQAPSVEIKPKGQEEIVPPPKGIRDPDDLIDLYDKGR